MASASREEAQKRLLFRWVQFSTAREEPIQGLEDFRDGVLLTTLVESLSGKKAHFKLSKGKNKITMIGNLQNALKFISAQKVRVTCSPNDLYDLNANMLFGLLWVLILKYQVQQKDNILAWVKLMTEKKLTALAKPQVANFDASWQDGVTFVALVNAIKAGCIDLEEIGLDKRQELLETAFAAAEDELEIPRMIDSDSPKLEERGVLTYLSYFFNKYGHLRPEAEPDPELIMLRSKVEELIHKLLDAERVLAETQENSQQLIVRTTNDLRDLVDQQKVMETELAESKEFNSAVNKKIQELTLKMPFYNNSGVSATPPPEGTVTLVFTDVQSSTDQWEKRPEAMAESLAMHNALMREAIGEFKGYEVKTEGDAFMVAFASAELAVQWCMEVQMRLLEVKWPEKIYEGEPAKPESDDDGNEIYRGLRVRMGVHTGNPKAARDPVNGRMDYFGPMVNRSARVEGTAHGGQCIISGETYEAIEEALDAKRFGDAEVKELGKHRLKGLQTDTVLVQILPKVLCSRVFPELKSPEKQEKADMQKQFEALQLKNGELKDRFTSLEEEAMEAAAKAGEFGKWLAEQGDKFPKSLAAELAEMASNVQHLMKSQKNLMKELYGAQSRCEETDKVVQAIQAKLAVSLESEESLRDQLLLLEQNYEDSSDTNSKLRGELTKLSGDLSRTEMEKQKKEELISNIQSVLEEKPKGLLGRIGAGERKLHQAQMVLQQSQETVGDGEKPASFDKRAKRKSLPAVSGQMSSETERKKKMKKRASVRMMPKIFKKTDRSASEGAPNFEKDSDLERDMDETIAEEEKADRDSGENAVEPTEEISAQKESSGEIEEAEEERLKKEKKEKKKRKKEKKKAEAEKQEVEEEADNEVPSDTSALSPRSVDEQSDEVDDDAADKKKKKKKKKKSKSKQTESED